MQIKKGMQVFIAQAVTGRPSMAGLADKPGAVLGFIGGHALVNFSAESMVEHERLYRSRSVHVVRVPGTVSGVTAPCYRLPISLLRTRKWEANGNGRWEWREVDSRGGDSAIVTAHARTLARAREEAKRGGAPFAVGQKVRRVLTDHPYGIRVGAIATIVEVSTGIGGNAYKVRAEDDKHYWWAQRYVEPVVEAEVSPLAKAQEGFTDALRKVRKAREDFEVAHHRRTHAGNVLAAATAVADKSLADLIAAEAARE